MRPAATTTPRARVSGVSAGCRPTREAAGPAAGHRRARSASGRCRDRPTRRRDRRPAGRAIGPDGARRGDPGRAAGARQHRPQRVVARVVHPHGDDDVLGPDRLAVIGAVALLVGVDERALQRHAGVEALVQLECDDVGVERGRGGALDAAAERRERGGRRRAQPEMRVEQRVHAALRHDEQDQLLVLDAGLKADRAGAERIEGGRRPRPVRVARQQHAAAAGAGDQNPILKTLDRSAPRATAGARDGPARRCSGRAPARRRASPCRPAIAAAPRYRRRAPARSPPRAPAPVRPAPRDGCHLHARSPQSSVSPDRTIRPEKPARIKVIRRATAPRRPHGGRGRPPNRRSRPASASGRDFPRSPCPAAPHAGTARRSRPAARRRRPRPTG